MINTISNIALLTDSYKLGHHNMYPEGTEYVYSYFESRNGAKFDKTIFFGLQAILREYFEGMVILPEEVEDAKAFVDKHIGPDIFNYEGWMYIAEELGGRLPLEIKAVPEGMAIPVSNVLMTVVNTDPKCFWLTNFVETILTHVWFPSTVATKSAAVREYLEFYALKTGSPLEGIDFQLHDFGFRGTSSHESAGIGGLGHLVNFKGTDTVPAIQFGQFYYDTEDMIGFSVPATEHSIMTSNPEDEAAIFGTLLDNYPTGILSVVCDSYDIFNCVENIVGGTYRDRILERDGVFVVRPDSGDPVDTTIKILNLLGQKFPTKLNDSGYTVLDPKIRVIWGDGIDIEGIADILRAMESRGWASENIVFGMGGGLLQKLNRDTQRFAFKCSAQCKDGEWHDVFKNPIDASKASKKGRLALYKEADSNYTSGYKYITSQPSECNLAESKNILQTVFLNGDLHNELTFEQVRENANGTR
jgi:nicotinamide phosphoribosyltransferase